MERTHALDRWLYRGKRPNRLARLINGAWARLAAAGIGPAQLVMLEVTGRRTGKTIAFPVVVADYQGERYLVSMLGDETNWVRNVRTANGLAVLRHGLPGGLVPPCPPRRCPEAGGEAGLRVLLSEASSLTAREHLSVLGPSGVRVEVASSSRLAIARFSRWCRRVVWVPRSAEDPRGYLAGIAAVLRDGRYDALLPTREQAWLFAAGRHLLPADAPLAVPGIEAFDQIQGKLACCRLLDALGLPQPAWSLVASADDARRAELPCWLKASFSTAGRGVRYVASPVQAACAYGELAAAGPVLAQQPAAGTYAQVAGLFSHGRLVAVHTSEQVGAGAGGSAAARVSVDHPQPRADIEKLGAHLGWHGGLTLDYLHHNGTPQYIEANARTVEPGNPAAADVDLPALTIAISRGDPLPGTPVIGRPGVRTHSSLALMLGAAERTGSRAAALRALLGGLGRRGRLRDSREVLTPWPADPPSLVPVLVVASQLLVQPGRAHALATGAVRDYAVPPAAIDIVRA